MTDLKVFGCSIEFLHLVTQTYLEDPIWDSAQRFKKEVTTLPKGKNCPPKDQATLPQALYLGCNGTLGCELQFAQTDTNQVLADPIQSKLRANHCCYVIAQQCSTSTFICVLWLKLPQARAFEPYLYIYNI